MNNLITDVKNLEIETLKNLKNSKSDNTLRAYQSDFRDFSAFCAKNGFSSLPTKPKIIALYITNLSKSSKFSTLKRRIASISVIHKLKGHYLDTKHPMIMENLHGIKSPKSARAVANACAKNPYAPKIPCHRVIRSDGALGGYSGRGGIKQKLKLLRSEKVVI